MSKKFAFLMIALVMVSMLLAACGGAKADPLLGKWVDEVGDSWEFKTGGALHAVAGGKDYDTTWKTVDTDTITIDFGPILTTAGDPKAVLTLDYTIAGDKLTLKFENGQEVPLTKAK